MTAPVYVPRAMIEGWVATATKYNPFTAIIEGGRSLMAGDPFHLLLAFAAAAGLADADGRLREDRPAPGGSSRRLLGPDRYSDSTAWVVLVPGHPLREGRQAVVGHRRPGRCVCGELVHVRPHARILVTGA